MSQILIAGDIKGNFKPLLKRLNKFDFALCVGTTLSNSDQLSDILNGKTEISRPIYFVDNSPLAKVLSIKYGQDGAEIVPNFHFLGTRGLKTIQGFKIAFFSEIQEISHFQNSEDHAQTKMLKRCGVYTREMISSEIDSWIAEIAPSGNFEGIDFLMTCSWPQNINYPPTKDQNLTIQNESLLCAEICSRLMPRYCFSANNGTFLNRKPFINYDSNLQKTHICRFIGIGSFPLPQHSIKAKGKYLYAIKTSPLDNLGEKLLERPEDTTENPFVAILLSSAKLQKIRSQKLQEESGIQDQLKNNDLQDLNLDSIFETKNKYELSSSLKNKIENLTENCMIYVNGLPP